MKLLVISMNFSPELTGIGKYSGEMAEGLVDRGHELMVVCAPPYYPAWRIDAAYPSHAYRRETPRPGLTVWRCPLWVPHRPSGLRRLLHQLSFVLASLPLLLWLALRWRPALVFAVAPATFVAPAAWLTAKLAGARSWLHVQDLELDAAFGMGLLRGERLERSCLAVERTLLGGFDQVSTISRRMLRQLACKGVALARTSLVPNGVDLRAVDPEAHAAAAAALRLQLGVAQAHKLVLFSGTMNRKQGLDVIVQAARRLRQRRDIVFLLCGQGEMRAGLEAAAQDLPQVSFLDLRPANELGALLTAADLHLLPQLRNAADLVLPSKLGGMLASGRAVIAGADAGSEIATLVRHCGRCVEPENADAFAQAIEALCDDDAQRLALGRAARHLAESRLGSRAVLDNLDKELRELTGAPALAPAALPAPGSAAQPR